MLVALVHGGNRLWLMIVDGIEMARKRHREGMKKALKRQGKGIEGAWKRHREGMKKALKGHGGTVLFSKFYLLKKC
jgi:hypothetical protein